MNDHRRIAFLAGLTGIVFVVLTAIANFIAGDPPDGDASAAELREFFSDDRTILLTGSLLETIGMAFAIVFFVVLAAAIARGAGTWMVGGFALVAAVLAGALSNGARALFTGVIWRDGFIDRVSDDVLELAWYSMWVSYAISGIVLAVVFGVAAAVILHSRMFHPVYGWISALAAAAGLVGMIGVLGAGMSDLIFVGFLGLLVGVAALSIAMIASSSGGAAAPAGAGAAGAPTPGATSGAGPGTQGGSA